ncbi:MAG TPA: hypothetical protein VFA44_04170 [Gaiellaceae bacterium]|nr:hypothetical protein [Gaiellaceae bacterium]
MRAVPTRVRSRRALRCALPLAVVCALLGLLLPGLGAAGTSSAGEPTISGGTSVGDTLTGSPGSWDGAASFKYNWRRCPPDGGQGAGNCEGIVDGPSNTYVLQGQDVGFTIRLQVKAFDGSGQKIGVKTSNATAPISGQGVGPTSTGLPTVSGTAAVGQTLTTDDGSWQSRFLVTWAEAWLRCDASGGSCSPTGASGPQYVVQADDRGSTLRSQVTATNPAGSTVVVSSPTAVVPGAAGQPVAAPPPVTADGCPPGGGPVPVSAVSSPARLVIDRQVAQPIQVGSRQDVVVRYHVSDTCGQSVEGALVYAAAVPFGQLSTPPETATGRGGFVTLTFRPLAGFPLGPRQRSVAVFVRARRQGEDLLAGISGRRLFAIRIRR